MQRLRWDYTLRHPGRCFRRSRYPACRYKSDLPRDLRLPQGSRLDSRSHSLLRDMYRLHLQDIRTRPCHRPGTRESTCRSRVRLRETRCPDSSGNPAPNPIRRTEYHLAVSLLSGIPRGMARWGQNSLRAPNPGVVHGCPIALTGDVGKDSSKSVEPLIPWITSENRPIFIEAQFHPDTEVTFIRKCHIYIPRCSKRTVISRGMGATEGDKDEGTHSKQESAFPVHLRASFRGWLRLKGQPIDGTRISLTKRAWQENYCNIQSGVLLDCRMFERGFDDRRAGQNGDVGHCRGRNRNPSLNLRSRRSRVGLLDGVLSLTWM